MKGEYEGCPRLQFIMDRSADGEKIVLEPRKTYDRAIIGQTTNGALIYSWDGLVECLMVGREEDENGESREDAVSQIEHNILKSLRMFPEDERPVVAFVEDFE